MLALALAALTSLSDVSLAAVPPGARGLSPDASRLLAKQWSDAFDASPECGSIRRVALTPGAASNARECKGDGACLVRSLRSARVTHAAIPTASNERGEWRIAATLVEAASGIAVATTQTRATAPDRALADAAARLCSSLAQRLAATAALDLELAPAAAPPADSDLDLPLDFGEVAVAPASAAPAPVAAPAAPAVVEPPHVPDAPFADALPPVPEPVAAAALAPAPSPAPGSSGSGLRAAAWVAGGLSVAASAGGAWFGYSTLGAAQVRDAALDAHSFVDGQARAQRQGTLANVSWGIAATAALSAGALYWAGSGD